MKKEDKPNNKPVQNIIFTTLKAIKKIVLYTRTSTYRNEVNFFASTLQNQKSPSKKCANAYTYGFNGQEKVDEISGSGNHNTAMFWEYDTRLGRRWNLDPKPQISVSDYACFANNPIWYADPNGDEVDIKHRKGFLGLGKKETLKYENGQVFNKDGTEYTGKMRGFLKNSVNALNDIRSSKEGGSMLEELEKSTNVFTLEKSSDNKFVDDNSYKAHANQWATDPSAATAYPQLVAAGKDFTGGSGGTIFWNPKGADLWEGKTQSNRPTVNVGHELFHGLDANRGLLDSRTQLGITRSEWQAVYRENVMRQQMNLPLRTDYKTLYNPNTNVYSPGGPNMLDQNKNPILPSWYKH